VPGLTGGSLTVAVNVLETLAMTMGSMRADVKIVVMKMLMTR